MKKFAFVLGFGLSIAGLGFSSIQTFAQEPKNQIELIQSAQSIESIDEQVLYELKKKLFSAEIPYFLEELRNENIKRFYDNWKVNNPELKTASIDYIIAKLSTEPPSEHWGIVNYNGSLPEEGWAAQIKDLNDVELGSMNGGIVINSGTAWYDVLASTDDQTTIKDEGALLNETTYPFINGVPANETLTHEPGTNEQTDLTVTTTGILEPKQNLNHSLQSKNYPNPFNNYTTIEYTLKEHSFVKINIYNSIGEHVKNLKNGSQQQGVYKLPWDGTSQNNESVSSGVYSYVIETKNFRDCKHITLIK
ncbi:MAG: FlgD immunoglobulin-like domain containing protein [Nanoarchaeota archaeon]|nr:gliding motility-associated C-terminal domain-containing protein [Nanoarchaeota archaeon]